LKLVLELNTRRDQIILECGPNPNKLNNTDTIQNTGIIPIADTILLEG